MKKLNDGSRNASNFLHSLNENDIVKCRPPAGHFHYRDSSLLGCKAIVLIGAGVGCTSLISMAKTIKDKEIKYIHVTKDTESYIMVDEINEITKNNSNF